MRLYSGTTSQFIADSIQNQIAEKLKASFFDHFRYNPSPQELSSWRNSLRAMSQVVQYAGLDDHGILVEYQLPLTSKRLDVMLCGKDPENQDNATIVELKQWEACKESDADNTVLTWVAGAEREVLHPSVQVGQYVLYLRDFHTSFYEPPSPVTLSGCCYLHNYSFTDSDPLTGGKFEKATAASPLFSADEVDRLAAYLKARLSKGQGLEVLQRVEQSVYRPSKKLMDHVGSVIKGNPQYVLLDEQLVVYERVLANAKKGFHDKEKSVILIKGGPGTGKSVIAINLMADLSLKGYNAQYATGSRAFTETLRKVVGPRGATQFKYFNSYADADHQCVDVLICDEAHRIRATSNNRFTPAKDRSKTHQIDELLRAGRVSVFFIDDDQVVRPGEIGSATYIKAQAEKRRRRIHEYELEAQFRCAGSDAFVNWVNNTLGIRRTANVIWDRKGEFDFRIVDSPFELEKLIREKLRTGVTARLTAGFCWKWSKPTPNGNLVDDVVIGEYRRPWNAKPEAARLAKGIPKAVHWAYDPNGVNQVGCVYTAQGFEFDYVGVIFGRDLRYDLDKQKWVGFPEESGDSVVRRSGDRFVDLVKNTYRVLLSRGMKGCYVHFMDKATERFFKSRME